MLKKEKPVIVEELVKLMEEHSVVGVLNMHKLPSRALQAMRENLRGTAVIKMAKKTLLKKALEKSTKANIKDLESKLQDSPALLLSNENPFKLFKILKENRTPAAAKPGDIAPKDIVIQKGPTPLPPGPSISTLQKIKLKASVQGGKIAVMADKTVAKEGEAISQDVVDVLSLLKMEPMEVGFNLTHVWEDGTVYGKDVLDVSTEDYVNQITDCVQKAVNLSVNTEYPTTLTMPLMIQKAFSEARALCVEANITEKGFIDDVLAKAVSEARALKEKTNV